MVVNELGALTLGVGTDNMVEVVKTAAVKEEVKFSDGDQANYDLSELKQHLGVMTEDELALLLNVKKQTLAVWRTNGEGPAYTKPASKTVLYFREDVKKYLACKLVTTNRTLEARE